MSASKRILVVGTGSIGARHLGVLAALPDVVPVAVPTRPDRVQGWRDQGFEALALDEALASRPAGAIVASDTGRHVADALACLPVCPVLVEKPLAPTAPGAQSIARAATETGHSAHVACCLRFNPGLAFVKARLERIGAVRLADAECLSWLPDWRPTRDHLAGYAARPDEGGVLRDLVHELDYLHWLLGPATGVSGRLRNRGALGLPASVDESADLLVEYGPDLAATVRLSFATRPTSRRLRLWGDAGLLEWDAVARVARLVDQAGDEVERTEWTDPAAMYRAQAEAWLRSLGGEDPAPLPGAADGVAVMALCDAARDGAAARSTPVSDGKR